MALPGDVIRYWMSNEKMCTIESLNKRIIEFNKAQLNNAEIRAMDKHVFVPKNIN